VKIHGIFIESVHSVTVPAQAPLHCYRDYPHRVPPTEHELPNLQFHVDYHAIRLVSFFQPPCSSDICEPRLNRAVSTTWYLRRLADISRAVYCKEADTAMGSHRDANELALRSKGDEGVISGGGWGLIQEPCRLEGF